MYASSSFSVLSTPSRMSPFIAVRSVDASADQAVLQVVARGQGGFRIGAVESK